MSVPGPIVVEMMLNYGLVGLQGGVDGDNPHHSRVCNIAFRFDLPIEIEGPNCVGIALYQNQVEYDGVQYPQGYGELPQFEVSQPSASIVLMRFIGGPLDYGSDGYHSLKDGVYWVLVNGGEIHQAGQPTQKAHNFAGVTYRLFGETNGYWLGLDGRYRSYVDSINVAGGDWFRFTTRFNNPANYHPALDFSGNGLINSADNLQFALRKSDGTNKLLFWGA